MLNKDVTLHRLDIQAFQSIIVEGYSIYLRLLVCKGFNTYFDGDQIAIHIPLSLEAQAEASLLTFYHTNHLSLTIEDPISISTHDILMGFYILTSGNRRGKYAHRYKPCNYQNKKIDNNNYKYMKEFFCITLMMQL